MFEVPILEAALPRIHTVETSGRRVRPWQKLCVLKAASWCAKAFSIKEIGRAGSVCLSTNGIEENSLYMLTF